MPFCRSSGRDETVSAGLSADPKSTKRSLEKLIDWIAPCDIGLYVNAVLMNPSVEFRFTAPPELVNRICKSAPGLPAAVADTAIVTEASVLKIACE